MEGNFSGEDPFCCGIGPSCTQCGRQKIPYRFSLFSVKLGNYDAKLAYSPEELESLLIPLSNAGVDIFHASTRRFWEPEFPGSPLNLAGWTKKITGKPTITVGSVGLDADFITTMEGTSIPHPTLAQMQILSTALEKNEYDLVAVGRALLGDPNWFQKISQGRVNEIISFSKKSLEGLY